ncbi:MAG: hypothetical protein IPH18_15100 [Chitinophagaceae bacterium]|nr:hypothetical protein [Chitinophagaceae bacterium]
MGKDKASEEGNDIFNNEENGTDTTGLNDILNGDSLQKSLQKAKEALDQIKPEDMEKLKETMKSLEEMNK